VHYSDGRAWAAGPDRVYGRLAAAAVALVSEPLAGCSALDVGAGTGAASRALRHRGARVLAIDRSISMLRAGERPAVVADANRLPVRSGWAHVTIAAFLLSHVHAAERVLVELARVTRPGGAVLATAFPSDLHHPVKAASDATLAAHGYRPPGWYLELKEAGEGRVGTVALLRRLAADTGLTAPVVHEVAVDIRPLGVPALVAWRLGMAQVAPYVATLAPERRHRLRAAVAGAVSAVGLGEPLRMLVLHARTRR
jgi:SAM-dependent methyltransferase